MADTYTVERTTHIDAPAQAIYERIVDFHRWPAWSPYEELDPAMKKTYSGPESGAGAVYEWAGNMKAGSGRMEITEAAPAERVLIDLQFLKPFKNAGKATFSLRADGDGTSVTWSMTGGVTMVSKVMGLFTSMDKMIGPAFEKGLAKLKAESESA